MALASDAKPAEPNIRDVSLTHVRRERLTVAVRMLDGSEFGGCAKNFDPFALVLDHAGADHLVLKPAIAADTTPRLVADPLQASHGG